MSMEALNWINTERQTTGTTRLCLMVLCNMANKEGVCWPSHAELALRCNVKSERSIRRFLAELESLGLTESLQNRKGKVHGYRLPAVADRTDLSTSPDNPDRSAEPSPDNPVQLTGQSCPADRTDLAADRTDLSTPYMGTHEPNEPNEPISTPPGELGQERGRSDSISSPATAPVVFSESMAQAYATEAGLPYSPEQVKAAWLTGHAGRNAMGLWRTGYQNRSICHDPRAELERLLFVLNRNGQSPKNGAALNGQLSPGMKVMRRAELEKRLDGHVANPLNGHTPMQTQRDDYRRLQRELAALQAA